MAASEDEHCFWYVSRLSKFQELVFRPRSDHDPRETDEGDGLAFLHDGLVAAAAEIKATTTSSRNRNKFLCARGGHDANLRREKERHPEGR